MQFEEQGFVADLCDYMWQWGERWLLKIIFSWIVIMDIVCLYAAYLDSKGL